MYKLQKKSLPNFSEKIIFRSSPETVIITQIYFFQEQFNDMSLSARIIAKPHLNFQGLIGQFANQIRIKDNFKVITLDDYLKMSGYTEIFIQSDSILGIEEFMTMCGTQPVYFTDKEVILDTNQGSTLKVDGIYWLHLEID